MEYRTTKVTVFSPLAALGEFNNFQKAISGKQGPVRIAWASVSAGTLDLARRCGELPLSLLPPRPVTGSGSPAYETLSVDFHPRRSGGRGLEASVDENPQTLAGKGTTPLSPPSGPGSNLRRPSATSRPAHATLLLKRADGLPPALGPDSLRALLLLLHTLRKPLVHTVTSHPAFPSPLCAVPSASKMPSPKPSSSRRKASPNPPAPPCLPVSLRRGRLHQRHHWALHRRPCATSRSFSGRYIRIGGRRKRTSTTSQRPSSSSAACAGQRRLLLPLLVRATVAACQPSLSIAPFPSLIPSRMPGTTLARALTRALASSSSLPPRSCSRGMWSRSPCST